MKNNKPVELIEEMTIKIFQSSNGGGYYYSIYDTVDNIDDALEIDGGLCTSDITNALEMATDQALDLVKRNINECHSANVAEYESLSDDDKEEVDQRISDMKQSDADNDDGWNGTEAQYLAWALEELWANKNHDNLANEIAQETSDEIIKDLKVGEDYQQEEYKNL